MLSSSSGCTGNTIHATIDTVNDSTSERSDATQSGHGLRSKHAESTQKQDRAERTGQREEREPRRERSTEGGPAHASDAQNMPNLGVCPATYSFLKTYGNATASGNGEPHCQIARIPDQLRAEVTRSMLEILEPEKSTFSPGIKTHGSQDPSTGLIEY